MGPCFGPSSEDPRTLRLKPRRSKESVVFATCQPLPSAPIRSSGATTAFVMKTSLKDWCPFICRSGRASTPGWRMSSRK